MQREFADVLAAFDLLSDELTPEDLTVLLKMKPDSSRNKGDVIVPGKLAVAKLSRWTLQETGNDLNCAEEVLLRLLTRLAPIAERIVALPASTQRQITLVLSCNESDKTPGIRLPQDVLKQLADLSLTLEITVPIYQN